VQEQSELLYTQDSSNQYNEGMKMRKLRTALFTHYQHAGDYLNYTEVVIVKFC